MNNKSVSPLRVAVLTNIIPRYRTKVFTALAEGTKIQLKFFLSLPVDRSDNVAIKSLDLQHTKTVNIPWITLNRHSGSIQKQFLPIPLVLPFDLIKFRPQVIVSGEMGSRTVMAFLLSKMLRVPLIIWSEETSTHDATVGRLQKMVRRFLYPKADKYFAWGKPATEFLIKRGVPQERVVYCAQAVDNNEWAERAKAIDIQTYGLLRSNPGTVGRVGLVVGQLIPRKGLDRLLLAYAAMPEKTKQENSLVLVGDGSEREALKTQAKELGITNFFAVGLKLPAELVSYYKQADFLILPSLMDVWGLVVNEAMACDLPVLSSVWAGATQELVEETGIGEAFDPLNQNEFTNALLRWFETPPTIQQGAAQQAVIKLNFDVSIQAIRNSLLSYKE